MPDMPTEYHINFQAPRPQWEYHRVPAEIALDVLNDLGREGWQVACCVPATNSLLLIREIIVEVKGDAER